MKFGIRLGVLILPFALAALTGPAFADSIDGSWCHDDGRRFSISGPQIVTPGGKRMDGNYSRHAFSYLAPAPEPNAGQTVDMTLANENTVYLRYGGTSGAQETWLRCLPSISLLTIEPPVRVLFNGGRHLDQPALPHAQFDGGGV